MRQVLRLSFALLIAAAAGCQAAGALMYKASGGPKMPADYKLGKEPALVFVENYANPGLYQVEAEHLERTIAHELKENKAATIVEPQKLEELRNRQPEKFQSMNIPAIASWVGAGQVVYVDLAEFKAEPAAGSDIERGSVVAYVKVVDARTGRTLWPPDTSRGREIKFETPDIKALESTDKAESKLYAKLTDKISTLFYDAPVDTVDDNELR